LNGYAAIESSNARPNFKNRSAGTGEPSRSQRIPGSSPVNGAAVA
jgi:hypothetical protein